MNNEYMKNYRTNIYKTTLSFNSMELEKHNIKIDILGEYTCTINIFEYEQDDATLLKMMIKDTKHDSLKVENTTAGAVYTIKLGLNYE